MSGAAEKHPAERCEAAHVAPAAHVAVDLDLLADLVAERVVERLQGVRTPEVPSSGAGGGPRVLTARETAERLGRSVEWVRDHRGELGQIPGEGARPRLLFDASAVEVWATARGEVVGSAPREPASVLAHRPRRRRSSGSGIDLLPIGTDREAA